MNKKLIRLTESDLHRIIRESVGRVLKETDFHRGFKQGNSLNVLGSRDSYTNDDVFICLQQLKEKLKQAEERAATGQYDEGKARNYLVGAIRGLQSFINDRMTNEPDLYDQEGPDFGEDFDAARYGV